MNSSGRGNGVREVLIPNGSDDVNTKKRATRSAASHTNDIVPGRRRVRKTKPGESDDNAQAKCIKYSALFLLVAQMVGLVLLMRHSRTSPRAPDQPLYLASTAVFIMEIMKLVICLFVVVYQSGRDFLRDIHHHVIGSPMEIVKLCVPSLLYTVQNNLLYLALTNLDAATYQVCYQLKILTTALFSALLLQRKFSPTKWASLVVLTVGVAIVQLSGSGDQHSSSATSTDHHEAVEMADKVENHNRLIGLVAVICAACTSGFSGVYFGEWSRVRISPMRMCGSRCVSVDRVLLHLPSLTLTSSLDHNRENSQGKPNVALDSKCSNGSPVCCHCLPGSFFQRCRCCQEARFLGRLHGHCLDGGYGTSRRWPHRCHGSQVRGQCVKSVCDVV
jgi:drug/metabolite transporter (DMT)-like permease